MRMRILSPRCVSRFQKSYRNFCEAGGSISGLSNPIDTRSPKIEAVHFLRAPSWWPRACMPAPAQIRAPSRSRCLRCCSTRQSPPPRPVRQAPRGSAPGSRPTPRSCAGSTRCRTGALSLPYRRCRTRRRHRAPAPQLRATIRTSRSGEGEGCAVRSQLGSAGTLLIAMTTKTHLHRHDAV